jgi:hypothetical protein
LLYSTDMYVSLSLLPPPSSLLPPPSSLLPCIHVNC